MNPVLKIGKTVAIFLTIIASYGAAGSENVFAKEPVRAVYLGDSFGSAAKIAEVIDLATRTEVNAVVVNIKDDDGQVLLGPRYRDMLSRLKEANVYIICRAVVFHDNQFAAKSPGSVLKSRKSGDKEPWRDNKKWIWIDPMSREYRSYFLEVISGGISSGCDEVNLDYDRFPSPIDGNIRDITYPLWSAEQISRCGAVREFLSAVRDHLDARHPGTVLSVDVFGYVFLSGAEPGIGQCLEDFAEFADVIAPMAYPTHYTCFDQHFKVPDPSFVPYKVYYVTLVKGLEYLRRKGVAADSALFEEKRVLVRPWVQAFSILNICAYTRKGCPKGCGEKKAEYGRDNFRAQIRALDDVHDSAIVGWMAWNPRARYSEELFLKK